MRKIIEIEKLTIDFELENRILRACDNVSLDIYENEIVAIIGESGSGKSTLASGILNLVRSPGKISSGQVHYIAVDGASTNILQMSPSEENVFRWKEISTVFQAAQNALNPVLKVKDHFIETVLAHESDQTIDMILKKAGEVLRFVRLDKSVLEYYPHQLSGGMKQRVLIAMSLILDPKVILLDEPTTALDVVTQYYILQLLSNIQKELGITLIFLTHDIAVVSQVANRIVVMYAGEVVERGFTKDVLGMPSHPYTKGLVDAIPNLKDDITKRKAIVGSPPDLTQTFTKCKFTERCFVYKEGHCEGIKKKTEQLYPTGLEKYTRCYTWAEAYDAQKKPKERVSNG